MKIRNPQQLAFLQKMQGQGINIRTTRDLRGVQAAVRANPRLMVTSVIPAVREPNHQLVS